MNSVELRDRLRRALQDGRTSDSEMLGVARLEVLSDQVVPMATPTATEYQVRFAETPTQGLVACQVVPGTLRAFVDGSPAPLTPPEDVDPLTGVFGLAHPPAESLRVSYCYAYFQDASLDGFGDEAREWIAGPVTYSNLGEVPDGLIPALVDYAAARATRALAAKCTSAATRKSGESQLDLSDVAKGYLALAAEHQKTAEQARQSYYTRADQTKAPAAVASQLRVGGPYTPIR